MQLKGSLASEAGKLMIDACDLTKVWHFNLWLLAAQRACNIETGAVIVVIELGQRILQLGNKRDSLVLWSCR